MSNQPPTPKYLDYPDTNGSWWRWNKEKDDWESMSVQPLYMSIKPGIWVKATPPQWKPRKEKTK